MQITLPIARDTEKTTQTLNLSDIHPIHPFPARMAPSIAFDELPDASTPLRILDPMVGSGTTAVVARAKGHLAIGFDTDPLAIVLSSAWSSNVSPGEIEDLADEVLREAKSRHKWIRHGYPRGADDVTKDFISYWFDPANQ